MTEGNPEATAEENTFCSIQQGVHLIYGMFCRISILNAHAAHVSSSHEDFLKVEINELQM
jgi:hypothetical protein